MKNKLLTFIAATGVLLLLAQAAYAQGSADAGKIIFNQRCASCHNINKILTGPALNGVDQRHSVDWILRFIHSSQTLVRSGDKDAVALFEKFNRIPMPDHPDLTDDNIKNILAYIKAESKDITKEKPPFARPPGYRKPAYTPLNWDNNQYLIIGYVLIVLVLVIVMLLWVQVKHWQRLNSGETVRH